MSLKDKTVLVAGAGGFIGLNVVKGLLAAGAGVIACCHNRREFYYDDLLKVSDKLSLIFTDLTDENACSAVTDGTLGIDYMVMANAVSFGLSHTESRPLSLINRNTLMNLHLLNCAQKNGVKHAIYFGSSIEYSPKNHFLTEDTINRDDPADVYFTAGWMKRYTEVLMRAYSEKLKLMDCTVLRLSNVFGPMDKFLPEHSHVTAALIKKFADRQSPLEVFGNGSQKKDLIFVDDVVRITLESFENLTGFNSVNVGSGQTVSINDIIDLLCKQEDYYPKIKHIDKPSVGRAETFDVTKMKELFGEPTVSLEEGLRLTTDWYKANTDKIYR